MINDFPSLVRVISGCTVSRHPFSCNRLTRRQDVPSHHKLMKRDDISQTQIINLFGFKPKIWGLYRPPSIICSGTGRPARLLIIWGLYRPPSIICSGTGRPARLLIIRGLYRPPSIICLGTSRPARLLIIRGLYRPPSIICSGTGRPARPLVI